MDHLAHVLIALIMKEVKTITNNVQLISAMIDRFCWSMELARLVIHTQGQMLMVRNVLQMNVTRFKDWMKMVLVRTAVKIKELKKKTLIHVLTTHAEIELYMVHLEHVLIVLTMKEQHSLEKCARNPHVRRIRL